MDANPHPIVESSTVISNTEVINSQSSLNAIVAASSPVADVIIEEPVSPVISYDKANAIDPTTVVSVSVEQPPPPTSKVIEGIVIPPDTERNGEVPDSFESMCIDAEVEVQMDLVSVIRCMVLYRRVCLLLTIVFAIVTLCFVILKNLDISIFAIVMAFVNAFCFFSSYKYSRGLMLANSIILLISMIPPIIYFGIDVLIRVLDKRSIDYFEIVVVLIYIVFCVYQYICAISVRRLLYYIPASQRDLISFMERENRKEIKPKLVIARY